MSIRIQILILAFVLSLLGFIFELLRRKKMSEALTLWWLSIIVLIIFLTLNQSLLDKIRDFLGVGLPLSVLLLFSLCFVLIMLIYFSMKISVLSGQIKDLTQDTAIFEAETLKNWDKSDK